MFDLNEAINNWRSQLSNASIASADLIELEDHLCIEIDDLICRGLTEQEAFLIAKHRLGENHSLTHELIKTNPWPKWRQRFFWATAGILGINLISTLATLLSKTAGVAAMFLGLSGTHLGILLTVTQPLFLLALLIITALIMSQSPIQSRSFRKPAAGIIIGLITILFILGAKALGIGAMILSARHLTPQDMGLMAMAQNYGSLILTILYPVALVIALMALWPSKSVSSQAKLS